MTHSDNTLTLISKVHKGLDNLLVAELKQSGITGIVPSHGAILAALFGGRSLSMNELAAKIGKTPQTVTTLVDKLESKGYIKSWKSQQDKRTTMVALTEEGEALEPVFSLISHKLFEVQYQGLTQEEIEELRRILSIMAANVSR